MSEGKKPRSTVMDHGDTTKTRVKINSKNLRNEELKLDEVGRKRISKTRNELYEELRKDDVIINDEDHYEFPTAPLRAIAFIIDVLFILIAVKIIYLITPFEMKLIQLFLDKYKLQLMFSPEINFYLVFGITIILSAFFLIVIPVTFFQVSLGKKITGIKVRSEFQNSLSIKQIIKREIIYKPLGIVLLAGFIMPFFDKKKKSFHDKLCGTIVVRR